MNVDPYKIKLTYTKISLYPYLKPIIHQTLTFPYHGKLFSKSISPCHLHLLSKINWMDKAQNYVKVGIKMGQSFTLWCDRWARASHCGVWSAPTKAPLISGTIPSCVEVVMVMWRVQMIWCVDYLDSSMGKPTSFSYALSYIMLHKIMIFHQLLLIHADWLAKPCHVTVISMLSSKGVLVLESSESF